MASAFQKVMKSEEDMPEPEEVFNFNGMISPQGSKLNEVTPKAVAIIDIALEGLPDQDFEKKPWSDLEDYEIDIFWSYDTRSYSDIIDINNILGYFEHQILKEKKEISSIPDLNFLKIMQDHHALFKTGKFSYEQETENVKKIYLKLKKSISKFCHYFDSQMIRTYLIQLMFPLDLLNCYLGQVNRMYGTPVYDNTLRLQSSLMEVFLWHHFMSDVRFNPSMTTTNMNLIDPFLRIKIRDYNRSDQKILDKYFTANFNIKKFMFKLMDLYFPNVTWRYVGAGQQMHKWCLSLMLSLFELGLFEYSELNDVVNALFQSLENLLILEDRSYKDFETSLKAYPDFNKKLKEYFYECKEIATGICIHIVFLINDRSFMQSHKHFNTKLKGDIVNLDQAWRSAYFKNTDISSILNRILTKYILRPSAANSESDCTLSPKTITYASDFLLMITDLENDPNYVCSMLVNQSTLEYYLSQPNKNQMKIVENIKDRFIRQLDMFAIVQGKDRLSRLDVEFRGHCEELMGMLNSKSGEELRAFQYNLSLVSVPSILLAIQALVIEHDCDRATISLCTNTFSECCKGSIIGQVLFLDTTGVWHLKELFSNKPIQAVLLIEQIFGQDFHIFDVNRTIFDSFISYFEINASDFLSNLEDYDDEKNEDGKRKYMDHKKWFEEFTEETINGRSVQLEELLTYYLFVRWLIKLLENQGTGFEEKFEEFILQKALTRPVFDFFLKIIMDEDFLPKSMTGQYEFKQQLQDISHSGVEEILSRKEAKSLTEIELRGIILEAAILGVRLMNQCSKRFFTDYIYTEKAIPILSQLLPSTEYILKLDGGLEYRAYILEFFSTFSVFPNNHLLTNRNVHFTGASKKAEIWIPTTHLNGSLTDQIKEQLEFTCKIVEESRAVQMNPEEQVMKYWFIGLGQMLIKYCKGMVYLLSETKDLDTQLAAVEEIMRKAEEVAKIIGLKWHGSDSDKNAAQEGETFNLNTRSLFAEITSGDTKKNISTRNKRIPDAQEKYYPNLYILREKLSTLSLLLEQGYSESGYEWVRRLQEEFNSSMCRPTSLSSKNSFDADNLVQDGIVSLYSKEISRTLLTNILSTTGLESSHMFYYRSLMKAYLENKKMQLAKINDENIFIKFLESGAGSVENIVGFFVLLFKTTYKDLFKEIKGEDKPKKDANDLPLMNFLQSEVMFSLMRFLDGVFNKCELIKTAFLNQIESNDDGKHFLSILYKIMIDLALVCQYKTFMNYDWKLLSERYMVISSFFKNLSENNFTGFKKLLGEFKPKIPGLPSFNSEGNALFFDLYIRLEQNILSYSVKNTSNRLILSDRAEVYKIAEQYLKLLSECAAGPYPDNQNKIYIYRTDCWMGIMNRVIDNMDSNAYNIKETVIDYFTSLSEENPTVTEYLSNNVTFDKLFDQIYVILKRLFILSTVSKNKNRYAELVKKAEKAHNEQLMKDRDEIEKDKKATGISLYNTASNESGSPKMLVQAMQEGGDDDVIFDLDNASVINMQMQDCITVKDYNDILNTYLKDEKFSNSRLLRIVIKLNDLLLKFSKVSARYSINMDNVYGSLIDRFADSVPLHIRRTLAGYQPKPNYEFDEKLIFYMFLTKITSQIEISNVDSGVTQNILYQLMPCTFFMTENTKENFMMSVDHEQIIASLVSRFEIFQLEMSENLSFYRKWPLFYKLSSDDSFSNIKIFLWTLGFLINVLLIIFYHRNQEGSVIEPNGKIAIYVLSSIAAALSFAFLIIWAISRYGQKVLNAKIDVHLSPELAANPYYRMMHKWDIYIYESILKQPYPIFFLIHILSCILGITVSPFFLTLQLLTIVYISATTLYVVKAITTHFDQLLLTFILTIFVIYCYTVLTTEQFFGTLNSNQDQIVDCHDLWDCLLYHVNFGLRQGGGIGDVTQAIKPLDKPGYYVAKFFYDMVFFILINIISLNIIFGIIIDTFADMRDTTTARSKALSSQCPVCYAQRTDIEKVGNSYKTHMDHDHNFWKYNNYICYLAQKDQEEMNGLEGKIWGLYSKRSIVWIPQAKSLEQFESEEAETNRVAKFAELESKLTQSVDLITALTEKINAIDEKITKLQPKSKDDDLNLDNIDLDLDLDLDSKV